MVDAARAKGIRKLGFSDHIFPFTDFGIFARIRRDIEETPEGPELCFGCETDVVSPEEIVLDAERAKVMDFVIAGTTHYQCDHIFRPDVDDPEACAAAYVGMFALACRTPYVDFVAHPFHVPANVFRCDPLSRIRPADLEPALRAARRNGVAMEIQAKCMDVSRREWYLGFYGACKEMGLKFAFGSDAHVPASAGATFHLKPLVDALGLTDEDVWLPRRKAGAAGA